MFCRLTCDISGVTRKVLSFSLVLLMSSFRVVTMVVLLLPLLKIISHTVIAFLAGQSFGSHRMCPSNFNLLSVIVIESGFVPVILYSFSLDIMWPLDPNNFSQLVSVKTVQFSLIIF